MYERSVVAGDILIKEGDSGLAANELYVVKTGEFEVRLLSVAGADRERPARQVHAGEGEGVRASASVPQPKCSMPSAACRVQQANAHAALGGKEAGRAGTEDKGTC